MWEGVFLIITRFDNGRISGESLGYLHYFFLRELVLFGVARVQSNAMILYH